jgi:hypothetical protein
LNSRTVVVDVVVAEAVIVVEPVWNSAMVDQFKIVVIVWFWSNRTKIMREYV